jgi:putative tryptophan/tyrosine transport system substrate-binding protein
MQRRQFITLLGGTAVGWPFTVRAQQGERIGRVGVLMTLSEDDPEARERMEAFLQSLQQFGWSDGRNVKIDYRWRANDAERVRYAAELVALAPDVILTADSQCVAALHQATRTVPIVFANVIDPVGAGYVESLARPGGNITGFTVFEYGISPKWLELLKQIAPQVTRAAVLRDSTIASGIGQLGAIQGAAPSFGLELRPIRRRRDRTRRRGLRADLERWVDCNRQFGNHRSPRLRRIRLPPNADEPEGNGAFHP